MSAKAKVKTRSKQRLIASADAARMLGIEPDTLRKRVKAGIAPEPHARQGHLYYYRLADIEHFAEVGTWPPGLVFRHQREDKAAWAPPVEEATRGDSSLG